MMVPKSVVWQLTQFELRRFARDRSTWVALSTFVMLLAVGAWSYWNALPPRPTGDRLFGYAYVAAVLLGLHAGLARDRAVRFDEYMTSNFASAGATYFAKLLAVVFALLGLAVFCFSWALITSAGDLAYAGWYSALFTLVAFLFLPLLVLTELLLSTRHPVAIVLVLFMVAMMTYELVGDTRALMQSLALSVPRGELGELGRLALRAFVAVLIAGMMVFLYAARLRRRSD